MYKQFRFYYLYTILPFAMLMLAAFLYRGVIVHTIQSNPHPQINYLIFMITVVGGVLAIMCIRRLMREVKELSVFINALNAGSPVLDLQKMALECDAGISYVLRMMAVTAQRTMTHQEQIALESEVEKASKRLSSQSTLPSFLGGLLVGVGLLGTFIGLLATLDDIAVLISSFSNLDMKTADPIVVFAQMVKRMEAPMHSMGVAFSASMYGLLGSMIIGFMMVSVKKCLSDLVSVLNSEVAQHIERSLMRTGFAYSRHGVLQQQELAAGEDVSETQATGVVTGLQENGFMTHSVQAGFASGERSVEQELNDVENSVTGEGLRVFKRIEIRLAESIKTQERALTTEIADFQKQRADFLRLLAENNQATTEFRTELQRVGRQLGSILAIMEKGNTEVVSEIRELVIRLADDSAETHRLLSLQVTQNK